MELSLEQVFEAGKAFGIKPVGLAAEYFASGNGFLLFGFWK
jgi:hypothetical protein